MIYLFILLPIIIAFVLLWYVDAMLEQRIGNAVVVALVEVGIALVILIFGLGFAVNYLI